MKEHQGRVPNSLGNGHLAFEVNDIDAVVVKLIEYGGSLHGTVTKKIHTRAWNNHFCLCL